MKQKSMVVFLFFLLLILALIFTAVDQARQDEIHSTPSPWPSPQLTPESGQPTPIRGWWSALPTAVPFPTPTLRN
jgi:hypothetical protein